MLQFLNSFIHFTPAQMGILLGFLLIFLYEVFRG
jgi:hypothetical protein